ncbi:VOC family protein [Dietzia sp. PP-33]|jgi:predicted enzyme related to lactoylglutathione lyase|uniref:VOC family protein n=1 Tax=Dietzia sp. PP-33 TaxID=2957500 RepID=UPI0029BA2058|nr:VOC family protein [Dietzia sp. PP-33]MDX2358546.1 VOC family protein [Dietzia sp. PP-33]
MAHITTRRVVAALDCPDARELADFYATMLGWRVHSDEQYPDWVDVLPPQGETDAITLGFQTVPDFRAPTWPEGQVPQQVHLDFYVDSIADSEPAVLAAGGRRHKYQPSPDGRFVVYLDPVGHPFCLCTEEDGEPGRST